MSVRTNTTSAGGLDGPSGKAVEQSAERSLCLAQLFPDFLQLRSKVARSGIRTGADVRTAPRLDHYQAFRLEDSDGCLSGVAGDAVPLGKVTVRGEPGAGSEPPLFPDLRPQFGSELLAGMTIHIVSGGSRLHASSVLNRLATVSLTAHPHSSTVLSQMEIGSRHFHREAATS